MSVGAAAPAAYETVAGHLLGLPQRNTDVFFRGRNVSCLTGIAADGVVTLRLLDGHVNGETFLHFCAENLLPEMSPSGPDIPPRCATVMDNASIHHVAQVQQLFVDVGVLLIFQPPYSPDFNVAELCFAFIKRYLAEHTHDFHLEDAPLPIFFTALRHAFNSITADLCSSWASHCGYDDKGALQLQTRQITRQLASVINCIMKLKRVQSSLEYTYSNANGVMVHGLEIDGMRGGGVQMY